MWVLLLLGRGLRLRRRLRLNHVLGRLRLLVNQSRLGGLVLLLLVWWRFRVLLRDWR